MTATFDAAARVLADLADTPSPTYADVERAVARYRLQPLAFSGAVLAAVLATAEDKPNE